MWKAGKKEGRKGRREGEIEKDVLYAIKLNGESNFYQQNPEINTKSARRRTG